MAKNDPPKKSDSPRIGDEPNPDERRRNSSSRYTIIIEKDLVGAATPNLTIDTDGNLVISLRVEPPAHTMDLRDPPPDPGPPPKETTLTLSLKKDR